MNTRKLSMAQIIVIGNEKGGSGKTTTSMHLAISLLKLGFSVGTIDTDSRQQSFTRYIENRIRTKARIADLLIPEHVCIEKKELPTESEQKNYESSSFEDALRKLSHNDFILIDTPGSDSWLNRLAHQNADFVVTPINDSFIDLDLIGVVTPEMDNIKPGVYSAMIWDQKMKRASQSGKEMKWIVVRNRLSTLDAINKRNVEIAVDKLAKRFGFTVSPGFSDRVIFKELFLLGLTLHDAKDSNEIKMNPSVLAARQELRAFVQSLNIPEVTNKILNDAA